jgi:hypothetical protein
VIVEIRNATAEEWDSIAHAAKSTIYFQTREWFDLWASYAGFISEPKLIRMRGNRMVLLPLAKKKFFNGMVATHFLAPKGMGGFIGCESLAEDEFSELFKIIRRYKMIYCSFNPYDCFNRYCVDYFNGSEFTQALDLSSGFRGVIKKWSKGHYSAAMKGFRDGITIEQARDKDQWREYYELYKDNLARWGNFATNVYSWRLFDLMSESNSGNIKLWLAHYERKIIAGSICLYFKDHVAYWHSATSAMHFRKLNSAQCLQYSIIENACETGCALYDFMPSGDNPGVVSFKKGFGAEIMNVNTYTSTCMRYAQRLRNMVKNTRVYSFAMKDSGF